MKHRCTLCLMLLCVAHVSAQLDHRALYAAYLTGDVTSWGKVLQAVEQQPHPTMQTQIDAANYVYGYIAFCLDKKRKQEAQHCMAQLQQLVDTLERQHYDACILSVYRSALAAYGVSLNRISAMVLASKAIKYAHIAMKQNPNNPMVMSLNGNIYFYRPTVLGGSKIKALHYYRHAVQLFESANLTAYNWNYLAALLSMAQASEKIGDIETAKALCLKILHIAPDFVYVRDTYYPKLLQKQ